MIKQKETVAEQNELIKVQMEYIQLLELDYYDPLNKKSRKYLDPI